MLASGNVIDDPRVCYKKCHGATGVFHIDPTWMYLLHATRGVRSGCLLFQRVCLLLHSLSRSKLAWKRWSAAFFQFWWQTSDPRRSASGDISGLLYNDIGKLVGNLWCVLWSSAFFSVSIRRLVLNSLHCFKTRNYSPRFYMSGINYLQKWTGCIAVWYFYTSFYQLYTIY